MQNAWQNKVRESRQDARLTRPKSDGCDNLSCRSKWARKGESLRFPHFVTVKARIGVAKVGKNVTAEDDVRANAASTITRTTLQQPLEQQRVSLSPPPSSAELLRDGHVEEERGDGDEADEREHRHGAGHQRAAVRLVRLVAPVVLLLLVACARSDLLPSLMNS